MKIAKEVQAMKDYFSLCPVKLKELMERKEEIFESVKDIHITDGTRLFLVGSGSSGEGLEAASYFWESILGIKPYVVSPYRFNHYPSVLHENDVVFALSQTGTSHEVVEALRTAKKQGAYTVGITTIAKTPITKECDSAIIIPEGIEHIDYKVVGVVTNMLAVFFIGYGLALNNNKAVDIEKDFVELSRIIEHYHENDAKIAAWIEANADLLKSASGFTVVGSGPLQETAEELAIKTIEVTNVQACQFDLEEYMHGGCAITTPNHILIMIVGHEDIEFAHKCYQASTKHGKKTIWLGPKHPAGLLDLEVSKNRYYSVFDAMAIAHSFIIKMGAIEGAGEEGTKIFAYYQQELKVRED